MTRPHEKVKNLPTVGYEAIKKRRKQRARRGVFAFLAVVTASVLLLYLFTYRDSWLVPLTDAAADFRNAYTNTSSSGFPISLNDSNAYSFTSFGDGLLLLTDTYLYTYTSGGRQLAAQQHGYSAPEKSANRRRILLYDKNGTNFALYGKSSNEYKGRTDGGKILYASLSADDRAAVVTTSQKYASVLDIYDRGGEFMIKKRFTRESVMQVCFGKDGRTVYASTLGFKGGDIETYLYCFTVDSTDEHVWKKTVGKNVMPLSLSTARDGVRVICDKGLYTYAFSDGERLGSYNVSGSVVSFAVDTSITALLLSDYAAGKYIAVCLDGRGGTVSSRIFDYGQTKFTEIFLDGENIYCLEGADFVLYNKMWEEKRRRTLSEEYSSFTKIGGDVFLLGYNAVDKITFN